jgi:ubiquitin C-terminal hydrolase
LLETLPKILIIHLKRFKVTYNSHKKLNYAINIPSELRLDYLLKNKTDSNVYNLFAIVVHVGNGIDYGHYFCLIKTCGKWFKFDDENVDVIKILIKLIKNKDINEFFGNPDEEYEYNSNFCAYMLLYEPADESKDN